MIVKVAENLQELEIGLCGKLAAIEQRFEFAALKLQGAGGWVRRLQDVLVIDA